MVVVAGHLCLDIIPALDSDTELRPGILVEAGPAQISTGGAVSNVGISLHKLGADVRLVGKVGDDAFGNLVLDVVRSYGITDHIAVDPQSPTSYTVVVSPPGHDRTFIHCPGCNDTFVASDVSDVALENATHFHFGYPPLMEAMSTDNGNELVKLFKRAKAAGLTTSLDMSLPDPDSKQGKVNWHSVLTNVLPLVDYFVPSEDELALMLPHIQIDPESLGSACLEMGAKAVVIKRGNLGVVGKANGKTYHQPSFPAEVVGTTGSGDATIAGILYGLTKGFDFQQCLAAGCAVGAFCVETPDAVSGIPTWQEVEGRFFRA